MCRNVRFSCIIFLVGPRYNSSSELNLSCMNMGAVATLLNDSHCDEEAQYSAINNESEPIRMKKLTRKKKRYADSLAAILFSMYSLVAVGMDDNDGLCERLHDNFFVWLGLSCLTFLQSPIRITLAILGIANP